MQSYTFVLIIITLITFTSILAQYSVQKDTQKELAVSFKTKQKVFWDPGIQNPLPINHHTHPPSKGNTDTHKTPHKRYNHTQNHENFFHYIYSKVEQTKITQSSIKGMHIYTIRNTKHNTSTTQKHTHNNKHTS